MPKKKRSKKQNMKQSQVQRQPETKKKKEKKKATLNKGRADGYFPIKPTPSPLFSLVFFPNWGEGFPHTHSLIPNQKPSSLLFSLPLYHFTQPNIP